MDRDKLMCEIMALDFAIIDLKLYLNTHIYDKETITLYNKCVQKCKVLKETYQSLFGPISAETYAGAEDRWNWVDDPWPWEKCANNCECEES